MSSFVINNPTREFVWKVETQQEQTTKVQRTRKNNEKKEPTLIKNLVEQNFKELSAKLIDKITALEKAVDILKKENTVLKIKLANK